MLTIDIELSFTLIFYVTILPHLQFTEFKGTMISLSVHVCVCVQNSGFFQSAVRGIKLLSRFSNRSSYYYYYY